jgi:hypothetical protein
LRGGTWTLEVEYGHRAGGDPMRQTLVFDARRFWRSTAIWQIRIRRGLLKQLLRYLVIDGHSLYSLLTSRDHGACPEIFISSIIKMAMNYPCSIRHIESPGEWYF